MIEAAGAVCPKARRSSSLSPPHTPESGPAVFQIEAAKKVCKTCTVVEPCLQWALETGQDSGVWGGLSEDERRALGHSAPAASINFY